MKLALKLTQSVVLTIFKAALIKFYSDINIKIKADVCMNSWMSFASLGMKLKWFGDLFVFLPFCHLR